LAEKKFRDYGSWKEYNLSEGEVLVGVYCNTTAYPTIVNLGFLVAKYD